jgi:hypothetical protein
MFHTVVPTRVFAVGILSLLFLGGCTSSDGKGPKLTSVSGRVIFKNEGVTAASIYFLPDTAKGNRGEMATAILQADGSFKMETYPKGEGVIPGAYKIQLDLGRRTDKELQPYRDVKTTPLSIEVTDKPIEGYVIELK